MKKNLFSIANVVDVKKFVLFGPHDVKFLQNIKELKADVVLSAYLFCLLLIHILKK